MNVENILNKRKMIMSGMETPFNYFDISNYIDLEKYSIYIFITPRNIGKTYSSMKLIVDVYGENGEYSVWLRSTDIEVKEILKDYKANRPGAWKDYMKIRGSQLIDTRTDKLVIKFVSLSTLGNLASIKGDGCFAVVYDEFLKRGIRKSQVGIYSTLGDFLKTVERSSLLTVILLANMTTLNNDILTTFDLWTDKDVLDIPYKRLRYRRLTDWDNPPDQKAISTAHIWAGFDKKLEEFMKHASVLDNSSVNVIPESRFKFFRNLESYHLNDSIYTLAQVDNGQMLIRENYDIKYGVVYDMTTEDGYQTCAGHIRPFKLLLLVNKINYYLETNLLTFATHKGKEDMIAFLVAVYGKIQKERD